MELNYSTPGHRVTVKQTHGYLLETDSGTLVDLLCGNTAYIWGYNNPEITEKITGEINFISGLGNQTCQENDRLVARLCGLAGLHSLSWAVSGSDGVEAALYINQHYWRAVNPTRNRIAVFTPNYHGTTYLTRGLREGTVEHAVAVTAPRWNSVAEREAEEARCLADLINTLQTDPTIGAVVMESCPWVERIRPWSALWWRRIRSLCDQLGINFIVDDVLGGCGKQGQIFSHHATGVKPDIVVLGKALTGGYAPLSCAIVNKTIADTVSTQYDFGHTWSPFMPGIRAANTVIDQFDPSAIAEVSARIEQIAHKMLVAGVITGYTASHLLLELHTDKTYPTDYLLKHGYNREFVDGRLMICAPATADEEYYRKLNELQVLL